MLLGVAALAAVERHSAYAEDAPPEGEVPLSDTPASGAAETAPAASETAPPDAAPLAAPGAFR